MKTTPPPSLSSHKALQFFNLFRLVLVVVLLLMTQWAVPGKLINKHDLWWWMQAYGALILLGTVIGRLPLPLSWLLTATLAADITLITIFMHWYGGVKSGFGMLLLPFLAVAGMLVSGRLALFYAALATFGLFGSLALQALHNEIENTQLLQMALLAIACFVTSSTTWLLARKARGSERLAAQRGNEIASLNRVNSLALQAVREAVLVLDEQGMLRQFNATAAKLLGELVRETPQSILQGQIEQWQRLGRPQQAQDIYLSWHGQLLQGRMEPLAADDDQLLVFFLQPVALIAAEAQQLKLAALGRLTASMAHEIRNPLAAISHAAELLAEDASDPMTQRLIAMVHDNSARIDRLVEEVLVLNRRDRVRSESFALGPFIEELLASYVLAHPAHRQQLDWQVDSHATIRFDRAHLQQILSNLLANACRHSSGAPGVVRLQANAAHIIIQDDGPGLPASVQEHLFEPFFTTENSGTGLGLYIARELAQANGARLDYLPPGGCFKLSLPSRS